MPRWEPRRLQPRATPRSVWFFAFSLLAALLMLWLTTRGGRGAGMVVAKHQRPCVRDACAADELCTEFGQQLLHQLGRLGRALERFDPRLTEQVEHGLDSRE